VDGRVSRAESTVGCYLHRRTQHDTELSHLHSTPLHPTPPHLTPPQLNSPQLNSTQPTSPHRGWRVNRFRGSAASAIPRPATLRELSKRYLAACRPGQIGYPHKARPVGFPEDATMASQPCPPGQLLAMGFLDGPVGTFSLDSPSLLPPGFVIVGGVLTRPKQPVPNGTSEPIHFSRAAGSSSHDHGEDHRSSVRLFCPSPSETAPASTHWRAAAGLKCSHGESVVHRCSACVSSVRASSRTTLTVGLAMYVPEPRSIRLRLYAYVHRY